MMFTEMLVTTVQVNLILTRLTLIRMELEILVTTADFFPTQSMVEYGDLCLTQPARKKRDLDQDMYADGVNDICIDVVNPDEVDSDLDGVGDFLDNCVQIPNSDQNDDDDDGIGNTCDNCLNVPNSNQIDYDDDMIGDACDKYVTSDNDNDTVCEFLNIAGL